MKIILYLLSINEYNLMIMKYKIKNTLKYFFGGVLWAFYENP